MDQRPPVSEAPTGSEGSAMVRQIAPRFYSRKKNISEIVPKGDFLSQLKATPPAELASRIGSLTAQEALILDLIVRGYCNKDISKLLTIEVATAKAHTSRIFRKLSVKNRVQAAVLGLWASLPS
jgi:DNA-binding NarL/FixJ family response regulator